MTEIHSSRHQSRNSSIDNTQSQNREIEKVQASDDHQNSTGHQAIEEIQNQSNITEIEQSNRESQDDQTQDEREQMNPSENVTKNNSDQSGSDHHNHDTLDATQTAKDDQEGPVATPEMQDTTINREEIQPTPIQATEVQELLGSNEQFDGTAHRQDESTTNSDLI